VIQGYILTLLDGGLEDPDINRKYLEKTEKSINRMITIVKDLETISRLEHGVLTLQQTNFDIFQVSTDIVESLEDRARKKGIKIVFKEGSNKKTMVHADPDRIRQVITNLIVNAINYGKEKGYVRIAFYDMEENIMIEIKDDGIGISEEHLPRLFERFYRVDKSRSMQSGGTGLGLAIVKHIIEAHKQTINIRSSSGVGTTIAFTLKKKN
ncbi:MAG: two-component sensor histidine kinase, partial [Marinilabiliales bacterium]